MNQPITTQFRQGLPGRDGHAEPLRCDAADGTGIVTASWYPDQRRLVLVADRGDHFEAAIAALQALKTRAREEIAK